MAPPPKQTKKTDEGSTVSKILAGISKLAGEKTGSKTTSSEDKSNKKTQSSDAFDLDRVIAQISAGLYERWDAILTKLESREDSENIQWITKNLLRKLSMEAPVVLVFVLACVFLHMLNVTILLGVSRWLGVRDAFHLLQPMQYIRLITHIFGHENMAHLRGNMTNILMVGPSVEEVFGSQNLILIILAVAISSGFGHILLGPTNTSQIGASAVVFAFILLNSLVSAKVGRIPISFVLTFMLWAGDELWKLFFANDQISHSAHLIGAMVGAAAGYYIQSGKSTEELVSRATQWNLVSKRKAE